MEVQAFEGRLTYGDVQAGRVKVQDLVAECFNRHRDGKCFREENAYILCPSCPKARAATLGG